MLNKECSRKIRYSNNGSKIQNKDFELGNLIFNVSLGTYVKKEKENKI